MNAMYASFATDATRHYASLASSRLIVEPIRKGKLLALLASLAPLNEPFPDIDDDLPPLDDVRL